MRVNSKRREFKLSWGDSLYGYDVKGNLSRVTDPRNLMTTYVYNGFRQVTQQVSPDTGMTNYAYDSAGRMASESRANGMVITYAWDALSRVLSRTGGGVTETFTYACVGGNPISRIDPDGLDWFRPWSDQSSEYEVGRPGTPVLPGGIISKGVEHCVPAGRTCGQIHDAKVDEVRAKGAPDWKTNVPTMPWAYWHAVKQEAFNSSVGLENAIRGLHNIPIPSGQ